MQPFNHGPRKRTLFFLPLAFSALLAGCQGSLEAIQARGATGNYLFTVTDSTPFPLVQGVSRGMPEGGRMRVYIEGDGYAWSTPTQPSLDPTPHNLLVTDLALADPRPSAYLARPCQFIKPSKCRQALWTSERFSLEVIESLDTSLTALKRRYQVRDFELVGYSGGGAVALLLAARRDDVALVQTLGGNLSPRRWASLNRLSALAGSLEPLDYRKRLVSLPQRHLLGSEDEVIASSLMADYARTLNGTCAQYLVLEGVRHVAGIAKAWETWRDKPLDCQQQ